MHTYTYMKVHVTAPTYRVDGKKNAGMQAFSLLYKVEEYSRFSKDFNYFVVGVANLRVRCCMNTLERNMS